jgi:S-DNA-T family DNA segregation ATPase FtsK/SpoIIIE
MMMIFLAGGGFGGAAALGSGFIALSMVGMMIPQMLRGSLDQRAQFEGERASYLRRLEVARQRIRTAIADQHRALLWTGPDPDTLLFTARGRRLWERNPADTDFGEVRIGLGPQRSALRIVLPEVPALDELDPVCARALRRFVSAYSMVEDLPVSVNLRGFARVRVDGDPNTRRALARAMIAQLVVAHSPEHVLLAVAASPDRQDAWDWVKWLPHHQHPTRVDGAGSARLFAHSVAELEREVLADLLADRARFEPHATVSADDPLVVVLVDGDNVSSGSRLAGSGYAGVVVLDVDGALPWRADKHSLGLRARPGDLAMEVPDRAEELEEVLGVPDVLGAEAARALAKYLARWRVRRGAGTGTGAENRTVDLCDLLGIDDPRTFDPAERWRTAGATARLRVPIGVDDRGTPVELDIRESAQGGMGPHGMLVGATGSGKSELLRTLVLAMALSHSSEYLNLVLVDFKGGATFVGMEQLPHTSALITNLADELPLVDRMQDAIHGELVRRQELLRATGHASHLEYQRARAAGAKLAPLPTLFLVIDEFSELLTARRDFINLFVMVGRLGRSLGVHLLLATQRIEEGRVHALEGHLSYRIGLRTFSAVESRSVLGVTDAYDTPLQPGMGFLRTGTASLLRFKAAYSSGALREPRTTGPIDLLRPPRADVFRFGLTSVAMPEQPAVEDDAPAAPSPDLAPTEHVARENTLLHVLTERLVGSGPAAHRVWMPPLSEPPSLDLLLGPVGTDPQRGLVASAWNGGSMHVPVGIIDRPFEQRWETLVADLAGPGGNVGIVGGAHSGKSTLLRTLVLSVALLNTPHEARFYCLDFSSGGLAVLAGLPHVGSVGTRRDVELVERTLGELVALVDERERLFSALGIDSMAEARRRRAAGQAPAQDDLADIFLVVDGWFTVRQDLEHLEPAFQQLAARGLTFGVHLVITSNRWSEIRSWLRDALGTKFELHLGDPGESAIGRRAAANVPASPGRGLTEDSMHFLAGLPRLDGEGDPATLGEATPRAVAAVAAAWQGQTAASVRTLPPLVRAEELPDAEGGPASTDDLRAPLGLVETTMGTFWWDFGESPHLVAFGDTETGKTTLLRQVLRAIVARYPAGQARILLGDFRRELLDDVPEPYLLSYATSEQSLAGAVREHAAQLAGRLPAEDLPLQAVRRRDWWAGPRVFVVVDDLDLLSPTGFGVTSPLDPLTRLMPQGADIGLHLVVTRSTSSGGRGVSDPAVRRAWELGNPALLLSCPKEEGVIFGSAKPRTLPPGRAQLVTRRGAVLVQLGYAADTAPVGSRA